MIKREAKFTVLFRHWINSQVGDSCAFELKDTRGKDYINFSEIKEHQIDALMAVKHGKKGILWKLPDDSRGIKPFDMFYLRNSGAYVVIKYPKMFCLIDIDRFFFAKERSEFVNNRKSLTSKDAKEIAFRVINL